MRKLVFKFLRYSGLPRLIRELIQRRKVTILLFHDISRETAQRVFTCLAAHYRIISLADYLRARDGDGALPEKALIITFDDGHIGNFELLEVVKAQNISVTIFLCAAVVGTNRRFWFTCSHPRYAASRLKRLPNQERLRVLREAGFTQEREYDRPQALTVAQIMEMKPYVDFQSHTLFHPCLPYCDEAEARAEIAGSKALLEQAFHLDIRALAFPNGDYCGRDIALAREAGYACALTVDPGFNTPGADPFRLRRLSVNDTDNLDELLVKASGLWAFIRGVRRRERHPTPDSKPGSHANQAVYPL